MKQFHEHMKWNKDEHERFEEVNKRQQEMIDQLFLAVFGDKNLDEKGMKQQVDEIYQWVTTGKLGYFGILKFFAALGVVSGGIIGVLTLFKKLFK